MKKLFVAALALFLAASMSFANTSDHVLKKDVNKEWIGSSQIKTEVKEGYKVDDAEYTVGLISKSNIGSSLGIGSEGVALLGGFALIFALFKSNRSAISAVFILGLIAVTIFLPNASEYALATAPVLLAPEEMEKLLAGVAEKNKAAISTEVKASIAAALVDKSFADEQLKKFKSICEEQGLKADTVKNLEEAIQKQGEELRKLSANQEQKDETVETIIEKNVEKFKTLAKEGARAAFKLEIPSRVINKTQVTRAGVSGSTMAMRLPDVGQLAYRGLKMANLFKHAQVDPSSNGFIRFYDQNAVTRAAAATSEGATKPESALTWIERYIKVEKIADSIPVTKEAWNDVYFIQQEIDRLLNLNLAIQEDALLWSGNGVSPQISGVYTTALTNGAFDGTTATKITTANIFDLIASMKVAIMNASNADGSKGKQSKYDPNVVVMNPADILALRLQKDSFGRYLFPADMAELYGMQIIESSVVTADTLMVGDTRYGTIFDLEGVTLEVGYINDQFIKNAQTLLAEKRNTLLIRNVDADGFLACSGISAAVANMTKV